MIYVFSFLLLLLGLVFGIPALRKLIYIRTINKTGVTTRGQVISTSSALGRGWWTAGLGNQDRPLIRYQSSTGTEFLLEVTTSSAWFKSNYQSGELVEVRYDQNTPGRAYSVREWQAVQSDLWIGSASLAAAIILWIIGRVYNLPA